MNELEVFIHEDRCCGFGNCVAVCPTVFALDYPKNCAKRADNVPIEVYWTYLNQVKQAADECPTQAITVLVPKSA
jgi:ferredoxin